MSTVAVEQPKETPVVTPAPEAAAAAALSDFDKAFAKFSGEETAPQSGVPGAEVRPEADKAAAGAAEEAGKAGAAGAESREKAALPAAAAGLPDPEAVAAERAAKAAGEKAAGEKAAADAAAAGKVPEKELSQADALANFREMVKEGVVEGVRASQPEPESRPAEPAMPEYTAEEKEFLKTYQADYPDVFKAEQLIRKMEYHQIVDHILNKQVGPAIADLYTKLNTMARTAHNDAIYSLVPDYDDIAPAVVDWARKSEQPEYLRKAFEAVISAGTPRDVADLVERWRAANPKTEATTAAATETAVDKAAVEAKTAVDKATAEAKVAADAKAATDAKAAADKAAAAAALAPTPAKRSGVGAGALLDPNNFDEAFGEFSRIESDAAERERLARLALLRA